MNDQFLITEINRIVFVDKGEYHGTKTEFSHVLHTYELIYKLSGEHILHFNRKSYTIKKGLVYILPKGDNNEYWVERIEPGACIDIFFQSNETAYSEFFSQATTPGGKIEILFKKAFSVWVAKNDGYYFECLSIIYKIFAELQKQLYVSSDKLSKIRPALDYIERHFAKCDLNCSELARLCGISYSYLKQIFLQQYKLSPIKYVNKMRMNYACDLLYENNLTIGQIAFMSGFSDVYYFSRAFKKSTGITPTEYASKYRSSK